MRLNPISTYKRIEENYKNYLKTLFYSRNESINKKLSKEIDETKFTKGPFVEQTYKFEKGRSTIEYIKNNILHKDIEKILKPFELNSLYYHQQEVIEKSIINNQNIIISTGTGSGKTLSFLIPVINYILKNKTHGVKAIFLYPMNALANDQLKDLRIRLKNLPNITFGRYTGETQYSEKDAIETYRSQNIEILENEKKSREELLKNPPDILITNYSMLEFLLLRPKDNVLFNDNTWKYIVLDEIHTYDGAKGSEIGYLLRRLQDRVFRDNSPLCIGASATLGDERNNKQVAQFAQDIFGVIFEKNAIIRAKYKEQKILNNSLWKLNFKPSELLKDIEDNPSIAVLQKYKKGFQPSSDNFKETLYQLLENNYEVNRIKKLLLKTPLTIQELSKELEFDDENELASLIELSFKARKADEELLYAKYHFFIKASDGLYAILNDNGDVSEIFFDKKITYKNRKVFELSACANCGEIFLTGMKNKKDFLEIDAGDDSDILRLNSNKRIYLSNLLELNIDEDEDENTKKHELRYLDIRSGEISKEKKDGFLKFLEIKTRDDKDSIELCPNCGKYAKKNFPAINYRFVTGDEIPQSVILLPLYNSLSFKNKKKVLVFSDSRKDAAFFAPFFERIYNDAINRKKLLYILTKENRGIGYDEVIENYLFNQFKDKKKHDYVNLLINEFSLKDNKSLENIGLVKFTLEEQIEQEILKRLNFLCEYLLTKNDIKALLYILLSTMRASFAIDAEASIADALDLPFKNNAPSFKKRVDQPSIGWVGNNKRVKFLEKLLNISDKKSKEIMEKIWDSLTSTNIFSNDEGAKRLKIKNWNISLNKKIYRCNKCGKIHIWSAKKQCKVFGCSGLLNEITINDIEDAKYYINLYQNFIDSKHLKLESVMCIEEHTAQLGRENAQKVQLAFENGDVNILSCSTTFELGVDIGSLECVFLHNVPPNPSNYIQRAGRAGRSGDSTAFIATFSNRRAHDIKYFENPMPLVMGQMKTPVISIENIRIIRRHMNSLALSYFLKENYCGYTNIKLKEFLEQDSFEKFRIYINSEPKKLKDSIKNILSDSLYHEMGIETWQWTKGIKDEKYEGCLDLWSKIETEVKTDIYEYTNLEKEYVEQREYTKAEKIKHILSYYENIDIISLFSQKIFIPKYGFPVDTVSLDTKKIGLKNISLDRDMSIALREYAPNEEIIADKKLITSNNMKIIKGKMPQIVKFYFCPKCGFFEEGINLNYPSHCPNCAVKIRNSSKLNYIVPIFGFEALKPYSKIPHRKPIPKSKIRSFYIGGEAEIENKRFSTLSLKLAKRGKITSINIDVRIDLNNGEINNSMTNENRLGYHFYTDVLIVENINLGNNLTKNYSLLFALLEGSSEVLAIKREDINGVLVPSKDSYKIVLYDSVPAGAGFMQEIYKHFDDVVKSAINIVKICKCDENSCCPVCLEHISNQHLINFIKRKEALTILESLDTIDEKYNVI
ncbi:MAG: DEAD/DEAH box helicase [Sulfurospirillaceae bacterium]|nr:DEAD/DEAH box helicase [Sulfurospirillaceae bacterium]